MNPTFWLVGVICVLNHRLLLNSTSSPWEYNRIKCCKSVMKSNWRWTSPVASGSHGVCLGDEGIDLCWGGIVSLWMKLSRSCPANWMPFQSQMSLALSFTSFYCLLFYVHGENETKLMLHVPLILRFKGNKSSKSSHKPPHPTLS